MRRTRWIPRHAAIVGLALVATLVPSTPAPAATTSQSVPLAFSGTTGVVPLVPKTDDLVCDECVPDPLAQVFLGLPGATAFGGYVSASTTITFKPTASLGVGYDTALLEEGSALDVQNTFVPLPTGTLEVTASYEAAFGLLNDDDGFDPNDPDPAVAQPDWHPVPGPLTFAGTVKSDGATTCTMPLPGQAPKLCTVDLGAVGPPLVTIPVIPSVISVDLNAHLTMTVAITADGLATAREVRVNGGATIADGDLGFVAPAPSTVHDPVAVPCGPAGKTLVYDVGATSYETTLDLKNVLSIQLAFNLPDPFSDPSIDLFPVGTILRHDVPLDATAAGATLELGAITPDATAPASTLGGPFGGNEGVPIALAASATDACGAPTLSWKLSDGGTAYGSAPSHVFADDGSYSGKVTATDARGNTTIKTFTVAVANVAPTANAGPDHSAIWGVPVSFHGTATDAGPADAAALASTWTFGDGGPAAGGVDATHGYANAGSYDATYKVCDDTVCASDGRTVTVLRRTTDVAYTGAVFGLPKKNVTLSAAVVDELGQPVPARKVTFKLGTQAVTATTGVNGAATTSMQMNQKSGSYTLTATLDVPSTDGRYLPSVESVPFVIGK
jgi:hypothetical protein